MIIHILQKITEEQDRQFAKWGEQNHEPIKWNTILMEEVGEVAKASLEKDKESYKEELIHVIAVAVSAYESMERNNNI